MKALFEKKKSSEGETGGRNEEVYRKERLARESCAD
jgi:hypothetical protein